MAQGIRISGGWRAGFYLTATFMPASIAVWTAKKQCWRTSERSSMALGHERHRGLKLIRRKAELHGRLRPWATKVVITTAADDKNTISLAFRGRCDAYIVKPIDTEEILEPYEGRTPVPTDEQPGRPGSQPQKPAFHSLCCPSNSPGSLERTDELEAERMILNPDLIMAINRAPDVFGVGKPSFEADTRKEEAIARHTRVCSF